MTPILKMKQSRLRNVSKVGQFCLGWRRQKPDQNLTCVRRQTLLLEEAGTFPGEKMRLVWDEHRGRFLLLTVSAGGGLPPQSSLSTLPLTAVFTVCCGHVWRWLWLSQLSGSTDTELLPNIPQDPGRPQDQGRSSPNVVERRLGNPALERRDFSSEIPSSACVSFPSHR